MFSHHPLRSLEKRPVQSRWALSRFMLGSVLALWAFVGRAQLTPEYELPPILYSTTPPSNRVNIVQQMMKSGQLVLNRANDQVALRQCLDALRVPRDTQVLVFSKTSLQRSRIHPNNPRAIYFSDDCYVGWVPGGLLEVAISDPRVGLAFYRFDPRPSAKPTAFERESDCLSCHAGPLTRDWPALMIRSVFPDESGEPISRAGSFLVDHESPLAERWGGWYVTGQHGAARHMGNGIARMHGNEAELDRAAGANRHDLHGLIETNRYLCPDSDIVALMILEHQVGLHNRLVEGGLRVRKWMHYQQALQKELGEPVSAEPTGTALRVLQSETKRILKYLLFVQEAPLPKSGIKGNARFPKAFQQNRRPDPGGRSLKDLDLRTRLFTYRCSYMIYSLAFDHLPTVLKTNLYRQLQAGLTAPQPGKPFSHLPADERQAIWEILQATKPELIAALH